MFWINNKVSWEMVKTALVCGYKVTITGRSYKGNYTVNVSLS